MRDINRIPRILNLLGLIWQKQPDWRLGQLIINSIDDSVSVFFLEDDDLEIHLKNLLDQLSPPR